MELSDILSLVKAGYTREEISAMEQTPTPEPNPVPVVQSVETPAPVNEPIPAPVDVPVAQPVAVPVAQPVPASVTTQTQAEPTMAEIMQSIAKLTSAVQANAIAQSVIPGGLQSIQHQPTAEDMLAEIIRPTYKAREGSI